MIVSQSGKMNSDSHALRMRHATLYWRLVAKLNYLAMDRPHIRHAASILGESRIKPERYGSISDWVDDHVDALQMGGEGAIRPHHGTQRQQIEKTGSQ